MKMPAFDTQVKVTVTEDCSWQIGLPQHREFDIEGKLVKSAEWDPESTIRVFTGNYDHPFAVIRLSRIKKLMDAKGKKFEIPSTHKKVDDLQTWQVAGSKGGSYTVSRKGETWRCECVGFQMRKPQFCRHIKEIRQQEGYEEE